MSNLNKFLKVLLFGGVSITFLMTWFYLDLSTLSHFPYNFTTTTRPRFRACISTQELIRRQNVFGLFAAFFIPPTKFVAVLNLLSGCFIALVYHKHGSNAPYQISRIMVHVVVSNLIFWTVNITLSVLAMHVFHPIFGSMFLSHLYNDCVTGPFLILVPTFVSLTYFVRTETTQFGTVVFFLFLCCQVFSYPQNCYTIIGLSFTSLMSATVIFIEKESSIFKNFEVTVASFRQNLLWILLSLCVLLISRELSMHHSRNLVENNFAKNTENGPKILIGILSVARPDNPRYLLNTLDSLLSQLPHPVVDKNIKLFTFSFTIPGIHDTVFETTQVLMQANSVSSAYIIPVNGSEAIEQFKKDVNNNATRILPNENGRNHSHQIADLNSMEQNTRTRLKLHVATALYFMATRTTPSDWLMIHEDDFPLCQSQWKWFSQMLNRIEPDSSYCGAFVATGGAGIVISRNIVPHLIEALLDNSLEDLASDQVIQDCLRGRLLQQCDICRDKNSRDGGASLVISSHLIFGHVGFTSSMGHNYREEDGRWRCGWMHPFNGDGDVKVYHTDEYL